MKASLNIITHDEPSFEIGKKQWSCLNSLAEKYKYADMSKISLKSNFEDDTWDVIGLNSYNFRWKRWCNATRHYPLILICKIISYHAMYFSNLAISTIQTNIVGFINVFLKTLEMKAILIAEHNQPFNYLSYLTSDDILFVVEHALVENGTLSLKPLDGLNRIAKASKSAFPNNEFLISGISTPWQEQGIEVQQWLKEIKKSNSIESTPKPYSPLEFKTVAAIVKYAIPFIEEHFDIIIDIFNKLESFKKNKTKKSNPQHYASSIFSDMHEDLDKILPLRYISDTHQDGEYICLSWFADVERLAQGAAAWIVLLTTGLRNYDMRNLGKGCCHTSARHNLLNYLITNIKKTNLSDYVLPVPTQTVKAVTLAELAKSVRTGDFVFTQTMQSSSDNTSQDPYKMNDGRTFNRLLWDFTSHYDIPLKTISDDKEATAHCVRATLAGYIGANSTAAILILKKLFGHSNALMPDAYLAHNPLVITERNKNITNAQETLAEDMAKGMVSGKLSGTKGKQMIKGAENIRNQLKNESENEMDMQIKLKERIKEMLLTRMQENQIYALKTPMAVVCMRNCSDSSDTPCAKLSNHEKRKKSGISKEITDSLATLPNPSQCVGKECSDALFGEAWSRDLLGTFDYYVKYLKGVGHQSIDIKNEAELFVKNYGSILKDIYADEREGGYFE